MFQSSKKSSTKGGTRKKRQDRLQEIFSAEESQKCAARTKRLLEVKKKETALVIYNYQNILLKKENSLKTCRLVRKERQFSATYNLKVCLLKNKEQLN